MIIGWLFHRASDKPVSRNQGRLPALKRGMAEQTLEAADLTMKRDVFGPLVGSAAFALSPSPQYATEAGFNRAA